MILTPKNWKSFQHYKERTPSWIKLHKGLLTDFEFVRLPVASRALAPMLWLLASEYEGGAIEASLEKIAFRVHLTVDELQDALSPLIDAGFFDASEVLSQPLAECLPREEDIGKRKRKEDTRAASPSNDDFEKLKKVYPRRNGNYGWKAAERKFSSLVKTGVDPKIIIDAARRFAANAGPKVGTEFIPMPASWLNSEDFVECAVVAFDGPQETNWDAICATYKKLGIWSKHAPGNGPDSPSCLCPPEILAKHGIAVPLPDNPAYVPNLRAM
jgi:hypothetical protein